MSCNQKSDQKTTDEESKLKHNVKVMTLEKTTVSRTVEYSSNLEAYEENNIAPAFQGKILKIYVEIGDHVKKGQLLVKMDESKYEQALFQYNDIKTNFDRYDTIFKAGALSEKDYDQTKMQLDVSNSNIEYLKENTYLIAPFSGVVTGKYYEDRELFSGAPNTSDSKIAIVTLMQTDPIKSYIEISEQYYPQISKGMYVRFSTDMIPGRDFEGTVSRIYPFIDQSSRTFKIETIIKNSDYVLKPGMYCKAEIVLGESSAFVVPASVVLKQKGSNERYVFTCREGKARRVIVHTGKRFNEKVEIISDEIDEQSQIICSGHVNLSNNMLVNIIK
jgi:RND family efflux transporter MFP subunit